MSDAYVEPDLTEGGAGERPRERRSVVVPRPPPAEVRSYPPSEVIDDPTGTLSPGTAGIIARRQAGHPDPADPRSPGESAGEYASGYDALRRKEIADEERYRSRVGPLRSALDRSYAEPRPALPTLEKVGPPPDQRQYQQHALAFMSAMSVLGAFTGRLSRAPAGTAMRAFAAAADGWREGNQQAYENGVKQWEASVKQTLENNRTTLQKYDLILKDRSLKREEMIDRLKLAAVERYDDQMYNAMVKGHLEFGYKLRDMQWDAVFGPKGLEAAVAPYKIMRETEVEQQKAMSAFFAPKIATNWIDPATGTEYLNPKTGQPYTDAEKVQAKYAVDTWPPSLLGSSGGGGSTGIDMASVRRTAELMFDGKLAPPTAMTMRTPFGQALGTEIQRLETERGRPFDPGAYYGTTAAARSGAGPGSGLTPAETRALAAALKDMEGQRAAIHAFEQTAVANGEILLQLAAKTDYTGVPVVDRWVRAGMRSVAGDPDVTMFDAQATMYKTEMARLIMNPNLKGVLTVDARHEIDQFINRGTSFKQLKALIPLLKADADRRMGKIDEEINSLKERLRTGAGPPPPGGATTPPPAAPLPGATPPAAGWSVETVPAGR